MNEARSQSNALPFTNITDSKWFVTGAALFLLLGSAFAFGRAYQNYSTPGPVFDWSARGLSDFHSMYTYSLAFRSGVSPYGAFDQDDLGDLVVTRPSAPFSPVIFLIMLPLTFLPLQMADAVLCLANVALIGWLARRVFLYAGVEINRGWWLAIFGFLVFSRPGHITLYTGYFTPLLVAGTLIAFHHAKKKPWLSGIGILLASAKPTYIIPLLILLVFRRNYKAAVIGFLYSGAVAFAGWSWLAADSSYTAVLDSVRHGQDAFQEDVTEFPVNTWTRIDLVGMFAKAINWNPDKTVYLGAMVLLLIPPGLVIRRLALTENNSSATGLTAFIGILALLVSLYHHSYDCLLVAVPWLALVLFGRQTIPRLTDIERILIGCLLLVPAVNYASTLAARNFLQLDQYGAVWQSITMLNGICLTVSLGVLMVAAFRPHCEPGS